MRYFGDEKSNAMALALRKFAEEEAAVERTPHWRILRKKAIVSICRHSPLSLEELRGKCALLGKEKIEKYGERIVGIVREYSDTRNGTLTDGGEENEEQQGDGVMKIVRGGFYYNVSGNDALLFHKHFGYKLFGAKAPRTGFPVAGEATVLERLDALSISYDLIDRTGELIISKRFEDNRYEILDDGDWKPVPRRKKTEAPAESCPRTEYGDEKKLAMIGRAKLYLKMLTDGVHPVSGEEIPADSAFMDEKVKRCFAFISEVLDEYVELSSRVEREDVAKEKPAPAPIPKLQSFSVSREQCDSIKLSKEPLTLISFMKNVNSVIDQCTMEKLTSTRVNKWLASRGLIMPEKVETVVSKTVYKPSEQAAKIGIVEEETVDKRSGEVKAQIKLDESAQLFIIENLDEIIKTTA